MGERERETVVIICRDNYNTVTCIQHTHTHIDTYGGLIGKQR